MTFEEVFMRYIRGFCLLAKHHPRTAQQIMDYMEALQ